MSKEVRSIMILVSDINLNIYDWFCSLTQVNISRISSKLSNLSSGFSTNMLA